MRLYVYAHRRYTGPGRRRKSHIPHQHQGTGRGLQAAIDERRADVTQTVVAERRAYGGGLLQREHHRNPKTGHVEPGYWYFRFREGSEQRILYVGKTDSPETVVDEKLGKDR